MNDTNSPRRREYQEVVRIARAIPSFGEREGGKNVKQACFATVYARRGRPCTPKPQGESWARGLEHYYFWAEGEKRRKEPTLSHSTHGHVNKKESRQEFFWRSSRRKKKRKFSFFFPMGRREKGKKGRCRYVPGSDWGRGERSFCLRLMREYEKKKEGASFPTGAEKKGKREPGL